MPFDPNKPYEIGDVVNISSSGEFDPTAPYTVDDAGGPTAYESFGRGAAQGASFDFADEITGLALALPRAYKEEINPIDAYVKERDESRAAYGAAEKEHPNYYTAGEVAGAIAPMAIPGVGAAMMPAKGAGFLKTAAKLAVPGALMGLGGTEESLTRDPIKVAEDVGQGAVLGGVGGAVLGKVGTKVGQLAQESRLFNQAVKKMSNLLFDMPEEYTAYLMNPETAEKIMNPRTEMDIAESIASVVNHIGKDAKAGSAKAAALLSDDAAVRPISRATIEAEIDNMMISNRIARPDTDGNLIPDILGRGPFAAAQEAKESLAQRAGDGMLSEREAKQWIQDFDHIINWKDTSLKSSNGMLEQVRKIVDGELKGQNEAYANAMLPVDRLMKQFTKLKTGWNLEQPGQLQPMRATDQTISKVKNFYNANLQSKKPFQEALLGNSAFPYEPNILDDIKIAQIAGRTNSGVANGSRNTLGGIAAGAMYGHPIAGAIAGYVKDKYGRAIGKEAIPAMGAAANAADKFVGPMAQRVAASPVGSAMKLGAYGGGTQLSSQMGVDQKQQLQTAGINPERLSGTPYESVVMNAAQQGPQKLATTHYLMSQRDPEYAALLSGEVDEDRRGYQ